MAFFSTGSEGLDWWESNCRTCRNWRVAQGNDTPSCVIWELHTLLNYDQCDKGLVQIGDVEWHGPTIAHMLGSLIPREKDGILNSRCLMYFPPPDVELEEAGQEVLFAL